MRDGDRPAAAGQWQGTRLATAGLLPVPRSGPDPVGAIWMLIGSVITQLDSARSSSTRFDLIERGPIHLNSILYGQARLQYADELIE